MGLKTELNRDYLGREFEPVVYEVTAEAIKNYADAYGDTNPAYQSGEMAPPIFPVVWELPMLEKAWHEEGLHGGAEETKRNVLMLVHGEQQMQYFAPVKPGDTITATARVSKIADKGSGEIVNFVVESVNQDGVKVAESEWSLFIRGIGSGVRPPRPADRKPKADKPEPEIVFSSAYKTAVDITAHYADASNDHNPIHLNAEVAKAAGLNGKIVHGLCTMAITMGVIIEKCCGGDPTKLTKLGVRFSSPVYPGDTLVSEGWEIANDNGSLKLGFEVKRDEDGVKVIKGGTAEIKK